MLKFNLDIINSFSCMAFVVLSWISYVDVDRVRGVSSSARHMLAIIPKSVKQRLIRGRCVLPVKPRCPNAQPRSELNLTVGLGPAYALYFKFTKSTSRPLHVIRAIEKQKLQVGGVQYEISSSLLLPQS